MGEWSPQCRACWWDEGGGPTVGAYFTGRNDDGKRTWETRSRVVAAEPGREFAWVVNDGWVRWGFTLEPADGGTRLTESWAFQPRGHRGLPRTLRRRGGRADRDSLPGSQGWDPGDPRGDQEDRRGRPSGRDARRTARQFGTTSREFMRSGARNARMMLACGNPTDPSVAPGTTTIRTSLSTPPAGRKGESRCPDPPSDARSVPAHSCSPRSYWPGAARAPTAAAERAVAHRTAATPTNSSSPPSPRRTRRACRRTTSR